MQTDIDAVGSWCCANKIQLNEEKCKVMQFTYNNRPSPLPAFYVNGCELQCVESCRYLGVVLSTNPTDWKVHCKTVLRRARAVFFTYHNFYRKCAPKYTLLLVLKCIIRPIIEYCADVILPNAYYTRQFERLQKTVIRLYLSDHDSSYDDLLLKCDLCSLTNRRAAIAVVSLLKYLLGAQVMYPGFVCYGFEVRARRSARLDGANDVVCVRNYIDDALPSKFPIISSTFKKSFLFRAVSNYNYFRHIFHLDSFYYSQLRRVLSLFCYDVNGIVVP
jgi:hypothetical protein